jgi:hypothetical protein
MNELFRTTALALSSMIALGGLYLHAGMSRAAPASPQVESQKAAGTPGQLGGGIQAVREYPIPTPACVPAGITRGPDGALWFAEYGGGKIGRVTTAGDVREFAIPTAASGPQKIAVGSDGALWFTETDANKIGRITVAGAISEFPVPTPNSFPAVIVAGPDGALWFTEYNAGKIGRISTQGAIHEYSIPTARSGPQGITADTTAQPRLRSGAPGHAARHSSYGAGMLA